MSIELRERETPTVYVFEPSLMRDLERRIRGDYGEMPGLRLTADQATRLWSTDHATCVLLLNALVEARFLRLDEFGRYARCHSGY